MNGNEQNQPQDDLLGLARHSAGVGSENAPADATGAKAGILAGWQEQPKSHGTGESVTAALRKLLDQREAKGIATYGESLATFNGRDATQDLVEELIDGAQYALQWRLERRDLLAEVAQLRAQLDNCEDSRRELCDLAEAAQERAASAEARASAAERDARDLARVVERLTQEKAGLLAQMARIGRA